MKYDNDQLNRIFDRTNGDCHLCAGPLLFEEYGDLLHLRAWEVDHDQPRARGGSDRETNLLPAHISCNRSKQDTSSVRVRASNGLAARSMSAGERRRARSGAVVLGAAGALAAGVTGAVSAPPGEDPLIRATKWALVGATLGFLIDFVCT